MSNTMPPGRDNIPLTHPRRIAQIAHLSDRELVNEPDEVRRLVAEYRAGGPRPPMLSGAALIAVERKRQIEAEGWTPEHDDAHDLGELLHAAQSYVMVADAQAQRAKLPPCFIPKFWPWERKWWKPSPDRVRNLVKAGALIAAEIDRLQRNGHV